MIQASGVGITGLGVFFPDDVRTNDWWSAEWRERHEGRIKNDLVGRIDAAREADPSVVDREVAVHSARFATDIFRGSRQRHVIDAEMMVSDMEAAAGRAALAAAGVGASEIDHLSVYSVPPDYVMPANHGLVAKKLGLRDDLLAFGVQAGCASFLPQLTTATALIRAGEANKALIAVGSATSRITDYDAPSSVLIGDGAVAAVVEPVEPGLGYVAQAALTRGELHAALRLAPAETRGVPWYRADLREQGVALVPYDREGAHHVGAHAASLCREVCAKVLDKAQARVEDVDFFVCAQSTAWFGAALAEAVGVPEGRYLPADAHFARYGHLLHASAPLNLYLAWKAGKLKKGDLVLLYSPGVGFIQAATLYRWNLD